MRVSQGRVAWARAGWRAEQRTCPEKHPDDVLPPLITLQSVAAARAEGSSALVPSTGLGISVHLHRMGGGACAARDVAEALPRQMRPRGRELARYSSRPPKLSTRNLASVAAEERTWLSKEGR